MVEQDPLRCVMNPLCPQSQPISLQSIPRTTPLVSNIFCINALSCTGHLAVHHRTRHHNADKMLDLLDICQALSTTTRRT